MHTLSPTALGTLQVSNAVLSAFVEVMHKKGKPPTKPLKSLRRTLASSLEELEDNYHYHSGSATIFRVERGQVTEVINAPKITTHAYIRMEERFGLGKKEARRQVLKDLPAATPLSKKAMRLLDIGGTDITALKTGDRVYVTCNKTNRISTVLISDLTAARKHAVKRNRGRHK